MRDTTRQRSIDWTWAVTPPRWMPRRAYVTAVSQLYHGERATLAMCRDLREIFADPATRGLLDAQIADEARHIGLYGQYLEKIGDLAPPEPAMQAALAGEFVWPGSPLGTVMAVHILIEGEGLRLQKDYGRWFPCALLRRIHQDITPDEARHVAFGHRVLGAELGSVSKEERFAMYRWLERLWRDCASGLRDDLPGPIRLALGRRWIDERWTRHRRVLTQAGLLSDDEARSA